MTVAVHGIIAHYLHWRPVSQFFRPSDFSMIFSPSFRSILGLRYWITTQSRLGLSCKVTRKDIVQMFLRGVGVRNAHQKTPLDLVSGDGRLVDRSLPSNRGGTSGDSRNAEGRNPLHTRLSRHRSTLSRCWLRCRRNRDTPMVLV